MKAKKLLQLIEEIEFIRGWYNYKTGQDTRLNPGKYHTEVFPYKITDGFIRYDICSGTPSLRETNITTKNLDQKTFAEIKQFIRKFRFPTKVIWDNNRIEAYAYDDISRVGSFKQGEHKPGIEEEYLTRVGKDCEIFLNPSPSEIAGLLSSSKYMMYGTPLLRFLADNTEKRVYIFDATLLHKEAYKSLGIRTPFPKLLKGVIGSRAYLTIDVYIEAGYNDNIILDIDWKWAEKYLHRDITGYIKKAKEGKRL